MGKKSSTIGTSRRMLDLFFAHKGEDKQVSKILAVHVSAFFKTETAIKLRGKPKAEAITATHCL